MILGIGTEAAIFLYAALTGISIFSFYKILTYFRMLVSHKHFVENLEDFIFWIASSAYVFSKIYETTYGEIRWFFVLGLITGTAAAEVVCRCGQAVIKWLKIKKKLENKYEND